mgnify:FL=1
MNLVSKLVCFLLSVVLAGAASAEFDESTQQKVLTAISGEHRSSEERHRDQFRKPYETLEFLGLREDMTVVEMWPGGGWYTKILAPVLWENGAFYAAAFDSNGPYAYQRRSNGQLLSMFGNAPDIYGEAILTEFSLPFGLDIAPPASADMVLTFRNLHNWVTDTSDLGTSATLAFDAAFRALKPGGVLGVVDHKWDDAENEDVQAGSGYISVERTRRLAESAGFVLAEQSSLLSNPKDTKNHPEGVWTLPPSYALGDEDRATYEAIGESDRFLLKFQKP